MANIRGPEGHIISFSKCNISRNINKINVVSYISGYIFFIFNPYHTNVENRVSS